MICFRFPITRQRQADHGMTLIEMMVVLVIVAVMAGLAISGLSAGSTQRTLSGAADVLVQRLALASDEAMVTGRPLAFSTRPAGYGFVQWQGDAGWQPVKEGPLAQSTDLGTEVKITASAQDEANLASTGIFLIAPGGDAAGFTVELQASGHRRLVLFDGLNARQINSDGRADDV